MTNEEAAKLLSQIRDALLASNSWLPSTHNPIKESFGMAINALSAQPETHEKRTKTHACDCISRKAAIDALIELYEYQRDIDPTEAADLVRQGIFLAEKKIEKLPSAQPQTCDDAISREDAKWVVFCNRDHVEDQGNAIDSLPCVQPQRTGRWIPQDHNKSNGMVSTVVFYYPKCSECGHSGNYDMNFCPNCGARMEGNEE